jgi:hypothetical protein
MHVVSVFVALLLPLLGIVLLVRWRRTSWLAAILLAASFTAASAGFFVAHCPAARKLSDLRWDMSREHIIAVVGAPTSTKAYPDGFTRISYENPLVYCTLDIYFDRSGKITRMFHDH